MRIFITGVRGFIGSHLYHHFVSKGYNVRGIDNLSHASENEVPFIYGDVRYPADIERHVEWADVVLHLAAQIHVDKSISNPQETIDVNVNGTLNVLEACRKYDKKLIFASTSEVYGSSQSDSMDESHPLDPQSPYAASKAAADRLCYSYFKTYGTDITILRNFNTFGPYQNDGSYGGVIAIFTRKALNGEPLEIFGDGNQSRDYMYIDDAVKAYEMCITNDLKGQTINAGSGSTVTINELAKLIKYYAGSDSEIGHVTPRPGEVLRLCAGIDKAKKHGFLPNQNFNEQLKKYVEWYKEKK